MAASSEQDLPTTTKLVVERRVWRTSARVGNGHADLLDLRFTSSSTTCGSRRVRPRAGPSGHGGSEG
jgi:hypothetical protein